MMFIYVLQHTVSLYRCRHYHKCGGYIFSKCVARSIYVKYTSTKNQTTSKVVGVFFQIAAGQTSMLLTSLQGYFKYYKKKVLFS